MKYELQTIPVWDGVRSDSECFLCDLMVKGLNDSVEYYLGSSVMDEETRLLVNRRGFCPPHWEALIEGGVPQALALISHTHLGERLKKLDFKQNNKKKRNSVNNEGEECLICEKMEKRLQRYTFTIAYMWRKEEGFKEELLASKGFCLYHLGHLLKMAPQALRGEKLNEFHTAVTELVRENLLRLEEEVWWMTQKYKADNLDKPWRDCEEAQKRVIRKLNGIARLSGR